MKWGLEKSLSSTPSGSTLVVFASVSVSGEKSKSKKKKALSKKEGSLSLNEVPNDLVNLVNEAHQEGSFSGKIKESIFFRSCHLGSTKNLLVVGLGGEATINEESLRVAGAVALNQLRSAKVKEVFIHLPSALKSVKDTNKGMQALCEGIKLAEYTFDELKLMHDPKQKAETPKVEHVKFLVGAKLSSAPLLKSMDAAQILTDCINFSRQLGDRPGNLMTPQILARETLNSAKGTKLKVSVWDKARIKREKMGGLLGVSMGSGIDPCFIILSYNGASKTKKPLAFVGKGLTFDSGGISLKPSAQMDDMRYDMCGGANVIGAMLAIARLGLKVNAVGLVPATENMPGPLATKPGDVLTLRNGKTAEVLNTDAEGRLILADALCYASEQKPAAIFDAATLTGAMSVALSNIYTGFFTRDPRLAQLINDCAEKSGELVWRMPLHDFHSEDIKGVYADIANISSYRGGGSSTAAAFLEHFVEKDIPWAHFDIAGTAWACGNRLPYCPAKGATGVLIRTFVELAKNY